LFQIVAGGSGAAVRQSAVTWPPRAWARQRAEVNKGLTSAKSQASLQLSATPEYYATKQNLTKKSKEINVFLFCLQ